MADHRHKMGMAVGDRAIPDRGHERELALASHNREVGSGPTRIDDSDCKPRVDRILLSLGHDRRQSLVCDRVSS